MSTIEKLYDIANEYFDKTDRIDALLATIGGYGSDNSSYETIEKYRGVGGTLQNEYAEIYDYMVEKMPDIANEVLTLIDEPDVPDVINPGSWKESVRKAMNHLTGKIIPALEANLQRGGVRATAREFRIATRHMITLVGFLNVAEEAIENPENFKDVVWSE